MVEEINSVDRKPFIQILAFGLLYGQPQISRTQRSFGILPQLPLLRPLWYVLTGLERTGFAKPKKRGHLQL